MNKQMLFIIFIVIICIIIIYVSYLKKYNIIVNKNIIETFENNNKQNNENNKNIDYIEPPFPIDVVYTWAGEKNDDLNVRLTNYNELKYSLRSIKMFIPWINHIYILMNPPKKYPSWMKKCDYITLIEHNELFDNKNNDITNSNLIETYLPYIKNLSEYFIYFNDDFFIVKKLNYTDFFTSDGKAIVPRTNYSSMRHNNPISTNNNNNNQKEENNKFKVPEFGGWYKHIPIVMIKSQVISYHKEYKDYIDKIRTVKKRIDLGCNFCSEYKLKCPCQQQHYPIAKYMLNNNMALESAEKNDAYFIISNFKNENKFKTINANAKFLCVNNPKGYELL
jgi:hypothetical protein